MSYLLAETTPDELLLMIAAEDGKTRPEPWPDEPTLRDETKWARQRIPPAQAPGFCWLNMTDSLRDLEPRFIYESRYQGFVVHLTWAGWDRVEALLEQGRRLPTEDELSDYARRAMRRVEGGERKDGLIPLDVPNPRGLPPRRPWWKRLFGMDTA